MTTGLDLKSSAGSCRAPGPRQRAGDLLFRYFTLSFGLLVIAITLAIAAELAVKSRLAWAKFGLSFLWTSTWDPAREVFGALPFIYGTLLSSALALAIAVPLGLGSALFLSELAPRPIADTCCFLIELLAAIPSVILGLMGIFILVPAVRWAEPALNKHMGFIPLFHGHPYGVGLLTAGLILSIMVLPYITSISREIMLTVPNSLKEGALALGATHWEMARLVIFPYASSGIMGSIFLALSRALGETMAVAMVIGNTPKISWSWLDPSYSMAAVIANEFAEATSDVYLHSLIAIGLALFGITIVINGLARLMIYRLKVRSSAP